MAPGAVASPSPHLHMTQSQAHGKHSRNTYLIYLYTEEKRPRAAHVRIRSQMMGNPSRTEDN